MKPLGYKTQGEITDEKLILEYDSQIIFEGYTDDLVTSITGDLELNLNFGKQSTFPVIARRYGEFILWIPKLPLDRDYIYTTLIFTLEQFIDLWTFLKYDPKDDLDIVKNISLEELKIMWLVLARGNDYIEDTFMLKNSVKSNAIAFSAELEPYKKTFYELIEQEWSNDLYNKKTVKSDDTLEALTVYLDQGRITDWEALKKDVNKNLYIHLGKGFSISV
ncbi:hypothetical protein [Hazenella coriacea]|uniref:Uncharacterized protein n=1 Tax=Hazenella coriacea TaxID=1179467 RepID=A0A4R3L8A7_9BACL|nr:hypothetical protein [Hazenella coriacea]TCS95889.1 hypothetical protein EDD58_102471 [Hazenella coriacea]